MAWLWDRVRFVVAAERAGYAWFAGIWRFLAPLAGLLALSGLIAVVLADVSWLLIASASIGLLLLLLVEGAYRLWREPPALPAVLPRLEALYTEGRSLKQWLLREFVNDRLESTAGLVHLERWTGKVVTALTPIRPGDAYQIEHEDAAHVLMAFEGMSSGESHVLNCLTERLSRLQDVIAELTGGQGR